MIDIDNQKVLIQDLRENNNEKIRFLGIDAFERKQECSRKDGTKYKCGKVAISNLSIIIMFFFNGDRAYAVINPVRPPPIINISLCNSFIIFLRNTSI